MMDIFVNECSLHEQFYDRADLLLAFKMFFSVLNVLLNRRKIEHQIYKSDSFYIYKAMRDEFFIASLKSLPDKSVKLGLINVLDNKLNARDWRLERVHSSDDLFMCKGDVVTDTSMAELAERRLEDKALLGLLINFPGSKFAHSPTVMIVKNEAIPSELDCVDKTESLQAWLEAKLHISRYEYDYSSTDCPSDLQTVLRDKERFTRTSLPRQGGRRVFKDLKTNFYWYVDSQHFSNAAHLEVFDSQGRHIGEADLDGKINNDKRDPGKTIDV